MFSYVLIDIDNTLLDFNKCAKKAMQSACLICGIDFSDNMETTFHKINDRLWEDIETGALTREKLHKIRWQLIFDALKTDGDGEEFEKLFVNGIRESHEKVDGAEDLVKYLSGKYTLCAASNGPYEQQRHRLALSGLEVFFSYVFTSESAGAAKPSKRFFEYCLNELHETDKSKFVLIGDSPTADIAGAVSFGIRSIKYNHGGRDSFGCGADFTVNSLCEIKNIL